MTQVSKSFYGVAVTRFYLDYRALPKEKSHNCCMVEDELSTVT